MKNCLHFMIVFVLLAGNAISQVPQGIPYSAVARNAQGQPLSNQPVKVRFSILDSSAIGTAVYVESHSATTSSLGLFSLNVGMGTPATGAFSAINWGVNSKFLKVELDTTGTGNSYVELGTQQMMSVPYALYAGLANSLISFLDNSPFYQSHGNLNVTNDTFYVMSESRLLEIKMAGGSGGLGGSSGCGNGCSGGQGSFVTFIYFAQKGDTLNFKLGVNGLPGCSFCSGWCYGGESGTNGSESIFSVNSINHSDYVIRTGGGSGGGGASKFWNGGCNCGGCANGSNGVVSFGANYDSKGVFNLQTAFSSVPFISIKW